MFFISRGLDDEPVIYMSHVRMVQPSYLPGADTGANTILVTWSNGDQQHLRYKTERDRDEDLARLIDDD